MPNSTEDHIWEQLKQDNRDALVQLYKAVHKDLLLYGMKLCMNREMVKDAINDLFIDIWTNRHSIAAVANTKAYLLISLRNRVLKLMAKEKKYRNLNTFEAYDVAPAEMSHEEVLLSMQLNEEIRQKISAALEKLTPRQRELIYLKFYEGLNASEIEQRTGMGIKTVYNTIYNALKVLGAELSAASMI